MRLDPRKIVKYLKKHGGKIRVTARELGISPQTVCNWRNKASTGTRFTLKYQGLMRNSTRPKATRTTALKAEEQDRVTGLRKETGHCAAKLVNLLGLPHHPSTVHRFLKKKLLTAEYGYHRRPLYQDTKHMHAKNVTSLGKLQMDVKYVTPELSGLEHTCYLYAVIDIFSRYKQGVILPLLDQGYAVEALTAILPQLPLTPDFIQTDNGLEFQKQFHGFVSGLGLEHHYIHKSNPNENAIIERSFRTDQDEFFSGG